MPSKLSVAESHVLESIQNAAFDVPGVVPAARGLSHLGEHALGWMGASAVMYAVNHDDKARRRQWAYVGAGAFTAHAASVVIKRIVRRKRPDYPYVRVGVGTPSKLSFPSSHSTSTTAFLVGVAHLTGNPLPLLGVPVMMASRMVLGVHYPTDTAVGAAIGAVTAEALTRYERKTA
ncbi:phosphatase PAP2 family protein [Corynebacterium striatum]|uniref:Phosphatase PAP2 family protein n=1 Tax=Corynebacterium striatum TaxID=43770 RepID=A0ABC8CJY0_CORST|nr:MULTISPECIES: phosphatase PAP2 family protein [Corynebacterium]ATZ06848.1 phosphatase PAP2 family protein [Corynebacterium striatum]ATZ08814.1 phosphatase PAP2 family protein [Corynebacterium striatum]EGT5575562.1 phosphatase PAP2 family protein [Corynebacterium striatum]EGT5591123.1 phosphatase PAP2 family protein [Corynebacterium striatum]EGT5594884.1 phosphatase PAP2 family protein [Corynebacterium striatum]